MDELSTDVDSTRHVERFVRVVVAQAHGPLVEAATVRRVQVLAEDAVAEVDRTVVALDLPQLNRSASERGAHDDIG